MNIRLALLAIFLLSAAIELTAQDEHRDLLSRAEILAQQYQNVADDPGERSRLREQVQSLVGQSFDARQASQREQIEEMREKLRQAESTLERRVAIRDRIVDRKVEDLLSGQSAEWKPAPNEDAQLFDVIAIGDVIAIYLPGVLPMTTPNQPTEQPPVSLMKSGQLITGYPITVGSDGAVSMPLVEPIEVAGLTVREAEKRIGQVYIENDILMPEKARPTITLIPKSETTSDPMEISRGITAPSPDDFRNAMQRSGVPSFDDTYGRISNAAESLRNIQSLESEIAEYREQLRFQRNNPDFIRARETAEQRLALAKLKLQLESDYMNDVIEQLKTDLETKKALLRKAEGELAVSGRLFKSGIVSSEDQLAVQTRHTEREMELIKAQQKLEQYEKVLARWNAIVGDSLREDDDSKQGIDEGRGR